MGQVALRINGRTYEITCEDGQEEHLREVGAYLDGRVREVAGAVGQVGEGRLLVLASLLMADELFEAKDRLDELSARDAGEAARTLDQAAERIDALARRLAQP